MSDDGNFISRWSKRKAASKAGPTGPLADAVPAEAGSQFPEPTKNRLAQEPAPLPPVESLTLDSDFTPFMQPGVDPDVKRAALRTLLRDPRFNVMDGLDVYIDDYSKPDPLPPGWLEKMNQVKHLGDFLKEPEKEGPEEPQPTDDGLRKAMHEEPVAFPREQQPVDTSASDSATDDAGNSVPDRV